MVLNKKDLERIYSPRGKPIRSYRSVNKIEPKSFPNSKSNIKVFVRVRPLCDGEQTQNTRCTVKVIDDKMLIFDPKEETESFFFHGVKQKGRDIAKKSNKEMQFIFDKVFSGEANNAQVYEGATDGIISNLLDGYNCSVFAYGATGAGKTHTMLGNKDNPGITFLTMTELYKQIDELKATKDIDVGVTYLEVYNENVHDLIHPSGPMHLRDDANGGVLVAGLQVQKIMSADQLFQLLQQGNLNRTQHPTDANAESSRSHAVFQVYVKIQTKASGEVKIAKLSMIDLAGSERGSATGCVGARFKEGSNINKSLLALGNCINNLADGLRHIPYRDSKLTRLLKDSLGGNCHTVMIANVSPSTFCYEDTYNTLKYATRAKSIKTQLSKNVMSVNLRVEHYVKMCTELKKENATLKERIKVMDQALRHPAVSPPRADPSYAETLNALFRNKKQIHTEWLTLEAQLMLLQWRIRCKALAANQMKHQMEQYGADYTVELSKNQKSLSQLEGRADCLIEKMSELRQKKIEHYAEYSKFTEIMEEAKVTKFLQTEANLREAQCEIAALQIQQAHHQKIINMQEKRLEDRQMVINSVTKICSDYHMILRGRDLITDSMDNEYQVSMLKLKELKAVTWMDEDISDEEEGATLSTVSVRPFSNLSIANLHSCSLPVVVSEPRVKCETNLSTVQTIVENHVQEDLNGTFVFEPKVEEPAIPKTNGHVLMKKTNGFSIAKIKSRATPGPKFSSRSNTPVKFRLNSGNKENSSVRVKVTSKLLSQTPVRPKTALGSRPVNIQEGKTPENKACEPKNVKNTRTTPLSNKQAKVVVLEKPA